MQKIPASSYAQAVPYVGLAGAFTLMACGLWLVALLSGAPPDTLTVPWLTIGCVAPIVLYFSIRLQSSTNCALPAVAMTISQRLLAFAALALLVVSVMLAAKQTQLSLLLLAGAHFGVFGAVLPRRLQARKALPLFLWFFAVVWPMSAGLSYTRLSNLLTGLTPSLALVLFVFAVSLWVVTAEVVRSFVRHRPGGLRWHATAWFLLATIVFAELALNTRGLLADWIPYHRDFWVEPARFIRQGHWLLWDVPSQYGFLSEAILAFIPARTVWVSLYITMAGALVVQAMILFSVLYRARRKWYGGILPLCVCIAVFFSAQASRIPYGPRLYPQDGLRTLWPLIILYIAWCIHGRLREGRAARWLTCAGHITWAVACLWSFETGIWATLIWFTFLLSRATLDRERTNEKGCFRAILKQFAPPLALLAGAVAGIEIFYALRLGHTPDWLSYVEFSALYSKDASLHVPVSGIGPGWLILTLLTAVSALGFVCARYRHDHTLGLLATLWVAIWGMSIYYAAEAFNNHVNSLVAVFVFAWGVIAREFASREYAQNTTVWLAKLSFVPMIVILLTTTFGEPRPLANLSLPGMADYHADVTDAIPPISGDLRRLFDRARITSADAILMPNRESWVKLDNGMIIPFLRNTRGHNVELAAWLPMSPVGAYNALFTLPPARRHTYIERFLQQTLTGGWYVTYRQQASCEHLSPHLQTIFRIKYKDYTAVNCYYRHG